MSVKYCPFAPWDKSVVNDPEISKQWCIDSCALWSNGGCGLLPRVSGDSEIERLRRIEKAVDRAIGACIFRDDPDRDELACDECQWREVCAALAKEGSDATA